MTEDNPAVWARMLRVFREKGVGGVWFAIAARAGYRRLVALERRLDEPPIQVLPETESEIRQLRYDDEAAFAALGQEPAGVFRKRLDGGHRCWGAWCAEGLRHVEWLAFHEAWVEYLGCRLILASDVVYVYRAFTQPQFRGPGLTQATQAACLPVLRQQDCRLALCAVLPENPWAFSPSLKVGYRRVGVISSLGFGGRRLSRVRLDGGGREAAGWRLAGAVGEP